MATNKTYYLLPDEAERACQNLCLTDRDDAICFGAESDRHISFFLQSRWRENLRVLTDEGRLVIYKGTVHGPKLETFKYQSFLGHHQLMLGALGSAPAKFVVKMLSKKWHFLVLTARELHVPTFFNRLGAKSDFMFFTNQTSINKIGSYILSAKFTNLSLVSPLYDASRGYKNALVPGRSEQPVWDVIVRSQSDPTYRRG